MDPLREAAPLLLDANVLIDLVKLGCLEQVAGLPSFEALAVDEVVGELKRPEQPRVLEQVMAAGLVGSVGLETPEELALMARLSRFLGAGEAASLACAASRGFLFATDERQPKLMREVRALIGEARLVRTAQLLAAAITMVCCPSNASTARSGRWRQRRPRIGTETTSATSSEYWRGSGGCSPPVRAAHENRLVPPS